MNETLAEIVAEMRHGFDQSWHDIDREWARGLADRIEAAAKSAVAKSATITGDAAAMREALEEVAQSAAEIMERVRHKDGLAFNTANYIVGIALAARAAPPRNCERFKTKEEAEIEFMMSDELPRDNGDTEMRAWMCRFIDWLFSPVTEQKEEGDAWSGKLVWGREAGSHPDIDELRFGKKEHPHPTGKWNIS